MPSNSINSDSSDESYNPENYGYDRGYDSDNDSVVDDESGSEDDGFDSCYDTEDESDDFYENPNDYESYDLPIMIRYQDEYGEFEAGDINDNILSNYYSLQSSDDFFSNISDNYNEIRHTISLPTPVVLERFDERSDSENLYYHNDCFEVPEAL